MVAFSVIMPAFNEVNRIEDSLERTHRSLKRLGESFEIIVVDDGSTDATSEKVRLIQEKLKEVYLIRFPGNRGKGEAIRKGFWASTGEKVFFLDADMDLPPEQIELLWDAMRVEGADVVIGSKMHPLSKVDYPLYRRVVSFIYFTMTRILFGLPLRDTQTGLKVFKREVLERCMPRMLVKAFAYDLELLVIAHHLGYRIVDVPVVIEHHMKYGFLPYRTFKVTGIDTLAIFYRLNILHYYDRDESEG